MRFWIDITDSDGVKYGDGPIVMATRWQNTARMDRAGTFTFTMPAADPKAAVVAESRLAYCYSLLDGVVTQMGAGIIKQVALQLQAAGAPILVVSGEDLLSELAARTVGDLDIYQTATSLSFPEEAYRLDLRGVPNTNHRLGLCLDGNPATYHTIEWYKRERYIYIGHSTRFATVRVTLHLASRETQHDEIEVQYFGETFGWTVPAGLTDGTDDGQGTMRQTGNITFTRPSDWVTTYHADKQKYWIRLYCPGDDITDEVEISGLQIYAEESSDTPVADVMAYAPTGWTVTDADGVATDAATPALCEFSGQSVLAALIRVAEITGEHFRVGTGKTLVWLTDQYHSGVYAISKPVGMA
jgi:hypothetical protein